MIEFKWDDAFVEAFHTINGTVYRDNFKRFDHACDAIKYSVDNFCLAYHIKDDTFYYNGDKVKVNTDDCIFKHGLNR